jgi:hypothetical protein
MTGRWAGGRVHEEGRLAQLVYWFIIKNVWQCSKLFDPHVVLLGGIYVPSPPSLPRATRK